MIGVLLAIAIIPAGNAFTCTPVRVWDGDGPIWCEEGPRVRLAGIAARELNGECRAGHPCPTGDAIEARDYLARLLGRRVGVSSEGHILIRGAALRCVSDGGAGGNRTAARCRSATQGDISCAMVRSGYALAWPRYGGVPNCPPR